MYSQLLAYQLNYSILPITDYYSLLVIITDNEIRSLIHSCCELTTLFTLSD